MSDRIMLVSADGHAGPPLEGYRSYVEPSMRDDFEAFLVAREEWRRERNRSMGLPEDGELVHALFGAEMVDIWSNQEAVRNGGLSGVWDSTRRNEELEAEGIVAEVLFPDFQNSNEPPWGAAFPFPITSPELRLAGRIETVDLTRGEGQRPADLLAGADRPPAEDSFVKNGQLVGAGQHECRLEPRPVLRGEKRGIRLG